MSSLSVPWEQEAVDLLAYALVENMRRRANVTMSFSVQNENTIIGARAIVRQAEQTRRKKRGRAAQSPLAELRDTERSGPSTCPTRNDAATEARASCRVTDSGQPSS